MAKAAKTANNQEKGKLSDEKYLGEEQNVEARVREMLRVTERQMIAEELKRIYGEDDLPWED